VHRFCPPVLTNLRAPAVKGGKGGKGKSAAGGEPARMSSSKKAGLQFPVARVLCYMQGRNAAPRVGTTSAVYAAAVLEYLTAEILELAGNAARDLKKKRLTPKAIKLAVLNDEELNKVRPPPRARNSRVAAARRGSA